MSQLEADVPVGALLSGGVDSSLVCYFAQKNSQQQLMTFSLGFADSAYDEAKNAKVVAQFLKTEHHEFYVTDREICEVAINLPTIYSEPFADSSQIPTHILSGFAKQDVTVVLTGDGGDELFAGYARHVQMQKYAKLLSIPRVARKVLSQTVLSVPERTWVKLFSLANIQDPLAGLRVHRGGRLLAASDEIALYQELSSASHSNLVLDQEDFSDPGLYKWPLAGSPAEKAAYFDSLTFLPNDIMTKVDVASMANSLEARAPFLDVHLVDFAQRIPFTLKMKDGEGKRILKKLLYKHIPRQIVERPKSGFTLPIARILRGDLEDWASDLLNPTRLLNEGILNSPLVTKLWHEHSSATRDWSRQLWPVLVFESWLNERPSLKCRLEHGTR
jgi:asparagine synthase (glutamine-hydrolysing)